MFSPLRVCVRSLRILLDLPVIIRRCMIRRVRCLPRCVCSAATGSLRCRRRRCHCALTSLPPQGVDNGAGLLLVSRALAGRAGACPWRDETSHWYLVGCVGGRRRGVNCHVAILARGTQAPYTLYGADPTRLTSWGVRYPAVPMALERMLVAVQQHGAMLEVRAAADGTTRVVVDVCDGRGTGYFPYCGVAQARGSAV